MAAQQNNITEYDLTGRENQPFFLLSLAGRIVFTSDNLKKIIGESLNGRLLSDFVKEETAARVIASSYAGEDMSFELKIMDWAFKAICEPDGELTQVVLFPVSKTGKAFMDADMAEFISRETNEALSVLFSSFADLERRISGLDGKDTVAIARKNLFKLMRLNRNMLDGALWQNARLELSLSYGDIYAFSKSIFDKVSSYYKESGINFVFESPEDAILMAFDEDKIGRIFLNLLSNSIKSGTQDALTIVFSIEEKDENVVVTIRDNGQGMNQDELSTLNGLPSRGLGLTVARSFAEVSEGSLVITSAEGAGTVACLTLPLKPSRQKVNQNGSVVYRTGGFDPVLIELSTILPKEAYNLK